MTTMTTNRSQSRCGRVGGGFTIVELLVTIAILFLLITAAFVAFKNIRKGAQRTDSLSALRQMMVAYQAYATEHDGRLMPGYVDPANIGTGGPDQIVPLAKLSGGQQLSEEDSASYVWRLAPYLGNAWETYMVDYRGGSMRSAMADEFDQQQYGLDSGAQFGIGAAPAFGLNSLYAGGDNVSDSGAHSPWIINGSVSVNNANRIAALRLSEVKGPSKFIVFGAVRREPLVPDALGGTVLGGPELRAPYLPYDSESPATANMQWEIQTDSSDDVYFNRAMAVAAGYSNGVLPPGGVPYDRLGDDRIPVGHLDGSVEAAILADIGPEPGLSATDAKARRIMSRWSPFTVAPN